VSEAARRTEESAGEAHAFPFGDGAQLELEAGFRAAQERRGLTRVQLAYGEPAWLATRMEDVKLVLADRRMSRALAFDDAVARPTPLHPPPTGLLAFDEPEHRRLRRLVADAFSREEIEQRAPAIREIAAQRWAAFTAPPPPGDLVSGYALELASVVIADILGIDREHRDDFRWFADCVVSTSGLPVEEVRARREALRAYMERALQDAAGQTGLLGRFAVAESAPGGLNAAQFVGLATAILVAGFETTANQIANFVYLLLGRPDLVERIGRTPDELPALVDELLRMVPLGVGGTFPRVATEDLWIGEQLVRRGETVIASLGAANQDPRAFEEPQEIRPGRSGRHVAMGHGSHFCLGVHLARTELQAALEAAFVTGPPPLAVVDGPPPQWREGRTFRGFASLQVRW
jgi:cytochrome P450